MRKSRERKNAGAPVSRHPVQQFYEDWVKRNSDRFTPTPYIIRSTPETFELRFKGVADELTCCFYIQNGGAKEFKIFIHFPETVYWDIVAEFSILERKTENGEWYDAFCIEPVLYSSRRELWEKGSFEYLLEWTNQRFVPEKLICLYGEPEKTSWGADILDKERYEGHEQFYHTVVPLLIAPAPQWLAALP